MSDDELNGRIAVEVMGEPEPYHLPGRRPGPNDTATTIFTERGNWWWDGFFGWKPANFCGDFTQAMRAVDELWKTVDKFDLRWLNIEYFPPQEDAEACVTNGDGDVLAQGEGSTITEAICRALLAYKEREEG